MFNKRSVRAVGLAELSRDLGRFSRKLKYELDAEIRKLAEPAAELVREEARSRGFSDATVTGIRPAARRGVALVVQKKGRTTGDRPDFGGIQYRLAFIPGAEKAEPGVERGLEMFLDRLETTYGL